MSVNHSLYQSDTLDLGEASIYVPAYSPAYSLKWLNLVPFKGVPTFFWCPDFPHEFCYWGFLESRRIAIPRYSVDFFICTNHKSVFILTVCQLNW
jgi:hypothetical protein